jgi:hypothetical protein
MRRVDQDALRRALAMAKERYGRSQQIESRLADEPWEEVAQFAARVCQGRNLKLKPWQAPPCEAGPTPDGRAYENDPKAITMKRRLLDAGLSVFEPDPIGALAALEARACGEPPTA